MHLFEYETFKKILVSYGEVLPYPIYLHYQGEEELVNTPSPVWLDPKATRKELLDYGAKVFSRLLSMLSESILKAARWKGCFMSCLSVHNFQWQLS